MGAKDEQLRQPENLLRNQLLTVKDLNIFKEELLKEIEALISNLVTQPNKKWLKSSEVRKLLNISPGTLQTLRINKTLPFQKVGGVMYYKWEDIERMMNKGDTATKGG